jgi:hypothetical protein
VRGLLRVPPVVVEPSGIALPPWESNVAVSVLAVHVAVSVTAVVTPPTVGNVDPAANVEVPSLQLAKV